MIKIDEMGYVLLGEVVPQKLPNTARYEAVYDDPNEHSSEYADKADR